MPKLTHALVLNPNPLKESPNPVTSIIFTAPLQIWPIGEPLQLWQIPNQFITSLVPLGLVPEKSHGTYGHTINPFSNHKRIDNNPD